MKWVNTVLNLDRRIIYSIVALLVILPLLHPFKLPVNTTPEVESFFGAVDKLPEGANIVVAGDFGPSSKPELLPMFDVILAHAFAKNLKVHIMTLWPDAPSMLLPLVEKEAKLYNKTSGKDYCFLGYKPGNYAVIVSMNSSVPGTFPTDFYGHPTGSMELYTAKPAMRNYDFIVDIAAGQTVESWVTFGSGATGIPLAISVTAVSVASYYPYLQAHQAVGLAGGMKGSAEYEVLFRRNYDKQNLLPGGDATKGMDAQSAVHLFIVLSIILANIAYFVRGRQERAALRSS